MSFVLLPEEALDSYIRSYFRKIYYKMKNSIALALLSLCLIGKAQTYPSLNISLLSHIDPEKDNTGNDGRKYSGCWGWVQPITHTEYAIVGTSSQTYFINLANPANPVIKDSVKGKHAGCTWREIKTYQNYCYIVSDDASPNSFQIVDMQYLPDSVHVVYDGNTYFERCHTLFVDKDKLYCGGPTPVGGGTENMRVYSLATPSVPVLVRKLFQDVPSITYVHDMYVRNDTVYASCGPQGIQIIALTASNTFSLLASYTNYQYNGYNHSSWLTENRKTMVFADESPAGLPSKTIDVSNLNNIVSLDVFKSHTNATAHNPYIVENNWCWMSTYQDGLYLYDISNPSITTMYGFFDTSPLYGVNDNFATSAYRGNWGAYPFLPSKIIIACDMQNGIFILNPDNNYKNTVGINEKASPAPLFSVYPNPVKNELKISLINQENTLIKYSMTDVLGKIVETNSFTPNETLFKTTILTNHLNDGCYFITLQGANFTETQKIIIQK